MTIRVNGKTYQSIEDMPTAERHAYERLSGMFRDDNGNGIPDFAEAMVPSDRRQSRLTIVENSAETQTVTANEHEQQRSNSVTRFNSTYEYEVDGKTYHSLDEMPADLRALVEADQQEMEQFMRGDGDCVIDGKYYASIDELSDLDKRSVAEMNEFFNSSETYVINGKTYHSLEEMPKEDRAIAEDFLDHGHMKSLAGSTDSLHRPSDGEIDGNKTINQMVIDDKHKQSSISPPVYQSPKVSSSGMLSIKNGIILALLLLLLYQLVSRFGGIEWLGSLIGLDEWNQYDSHPY